MQFSLQHCSDAVLWINAKAGIDYVNEAACRALERSHEELLSLSIPDIDHFSQQIVGHGSGMSSRRTTP